MCAIEKGHQLHTLTGKLYVPMMIQGTLATTAVL